MLVCNGCQRHVRVEESACPFCGAAIAMICAPSPARLGSTMVLTAGLGLLACGEGKDSDDMAMDTAGETMTTLGDGDGDPNEDLDRGGSDYGGPELTSESDTDTGEDVIFCTDFGPTPAMVGLNPVTVEAGSLLEGSCGGIGPEAIYSFVAAVDGDHTFAVIDADFEATLYVVGPICDPLDELDCVTVPDVVTMPMTIGQTVHVVVDSSGAAGTASLEITTM
jgi:hypothetical protein